MPTDVISQAATFGPFVFFTVILLLILGLVVKTFLEYIQKINASLLDVISVNTTAQNNLAVTIAALTNSLGASQLRLEERMRMLERRRTGKAR